MTDIITKAKMNLKEGIIELEGNESFVTKYLEEFKEKITKENISKREKTSFEEKLIKKKEKINSNPKKVEIEPFEIKGDESQNIPSLKKFYEDKKPGEGSPSRITVIGYYVTKIINKEEFSEGNVEFAYTALKLNKRPKHLHQAMLDAKNINRYLESLSDKDKWTLGRIGELHVEDELPPKDGE